MIFNVVGTLNTVVADYTNTMKTNFDFNFNLYKAVKQHGYAHINIEVKISCQLKDDLFDYLIKKVVFIVLI